MKIQKPILLVVFLLFLTTPTAYTQGLLTYLPLIFKAGAMSTPEPILRIMTQDGKIVDLLEDWEVVDPYWRPKIASYKNDGHYVDSPLADGSRLVFKKYGNVVESIPLTGKGPNQAQAIKKLRELLQALRQAGDYWTESYEQDFAWLEVRPACSDCRTGYARIVKANIPELNSPFTQPFFSAYNEAVLDELTLIIEREPLWRGVQPGTTLGPLFNVLKNPDFELWNFGVTDSQPDNWSDLETTHITGSNNREDDSHSGEYSLRVNVGGSTQSGRFKGISQVVSGIRANTTYTMVAWVRNDGVSNGVGRILVTYSSQLEIYRSSSKHGWTLYTGTFTTGASDTVAINLEILTTAANTDGTVYFDSLMLLEGDLEAEALDGFLPYMTSSHIVNHWDQVNSTLIEAGDLNYVDMWNIPGDESALVRLEMVNSTPDSGVNSPVVFQTVRAGMRRTKDVFQFTNFYDPPGVTDTTASGDDRINSGTLGTDWTTVGFFTIDDADIVPHNLGRFRVLARVWDASTSGAFNLEVRLRYWIGQSGTNVKTLESVTVPGRGSWYIVDLTGNTAMNWDVRSKNLPGSLGFEIQMRRATGTDQGRLDYAMVLPTDGGVLFANISPSIPLNSGLVVDGTNSSDVYGARLERGWQEVFQTDAGDNEQPVLKDFNGALYIGTVNQRLYRFQNNGGVFLYDYGTGSNYIALEVFNNKLYIMSHQGVSPGIGNSTDGTTFPGTADFTFGTTLTFPFKAKAYQGHLYFVGTTGFGGNGVLWDWDGAAATATQRIGSAAYDHFTSIGAYKNRIYIGALQITTSFAQVVEYNPATATHSTILTTAADALRPSEFAEFGGLLYWVSGGQSDDIYRFDGSTFETLTPLSLGMQWHGITVAGDRLYITGRRVSTNQAYVLSSTDGENWTVEYAPGTTSIERGLSLAVSQGRIFMGTQTAVGQRARLHATTVTENQYKVPDYQLSEFKAPNREWGNQRRHRYFFSYSRENGVNVQDDSMLVGVGIVPMYLSLIGDGAD